jgi:hypothetical protein
LPVAAVDDHGPRRLLHGLDERVRVERDEAARIDDFGGYPLPFQLIAL